MKLTTRKLLLGAAAATLTTSIVVLATTSAAQAVAKPAQHVDCATAACDSYFQPAPAPQGPTDA